MPATNLAAIVTTDLTAITRGRFLPADRIDRSATGTGWVPANLALRTNGIIPADNIWGTSGDLRLVPDLEARYSTALTGAPTPFDMTMGDLVTPDGAPWPGCTRLQLKQARDDLEAATGLRVMAAFEHEFQIVEPALSDAHVFSFQALRRIEPFAGRYFAALEDAGTEPETLLSEYGEQQYEITSRQTGALAAADRAIAIREITREMCRIEGMRASFAPKTGPDQVGNGVHVHFSLIDRDGNPAAYDAGMPGCLSKAGGAFCAGIIEHMPDFLALTAPSAASYLRLQPDSWSPTRVRLAEGDRGASLRICPILAMSRRKPAEQFNIEYRAADATANPYLVLAALLRAGLDGLLRGLKPVVSSEATQSASQLRGGAREEHRLAQTLGDALDKMQASEAVKGWFPASLLQTFLDIKRDEVLAADGLTDAELCSISQRHY